MINRFSFSFNGYNQYDGNKEYIAEFTDLGRLNILIGKNNAGKSTALNAVESVFNDDSDLNKFEKKLIISVHANYIKNSEWRNYVKEFEINSTSETIVDIVLKNTDGETGTFCNDEPVKLDAEHWYQKIKLRRLSADRDVFKELDTEYVFGKDLCLSRNGNGATTLIQRTLNLTSKNPSKIKNDLLKELNKIVMPDTEFIDITTRKHDTSDGDLKDRWEIFLTEDGKDPYALSNYGSGMKTVILVLLNLIIMPNEIDTPKNNIIFQFEELENNLHPSMQRRLIDYVYRYAVENECCIFITTHSSVPINMFYGKKDVRIYHICKEEKTTKISKIESSDEERNILDDLGMKASDILQSNGIIWVEGPSDRIYLEKWLSIYTKNKDLKFIEGKDYQYMYYGGRLLSHYTVNEELANLINILTINRNAAILIDSDKRKEDDDINDTKKRIGKEFRDNNGLVWITDGKEIENYLTYTLLNDTFSDSIPNSIFNKYMPFDEFIKKHTNEESKKCFKSGKVTFSHMVCEKMNDSNWIEPDLKLNTKIEELYNKIKTWNSN